MHFENPFHEILSPRLSRCRERIVPTFKLFFLIPIIFAGCSTADPVRIIVPQRIPVKPVLLPCQEPARLPEWMATVDFTEQMDEWTRQTLLTNAENGRRFKSCRLSQQILIDWINTLE